MDLNNRKIVHTPLKCRVKQHKNWDNFAVTYWVPEWGLNNQSAIHQSDRIPDSDAHGYWRWYYPVGYQIVWKASGIQHNRNRTEYPAHTCTLDKNLATEPVTTTGILQKVMTPTHSSTYLRELFRGILQAKDMANTMSVKHLVTIFLKLSTSSLRLQRTWMYRCISFGKISVLQNFEKFPDKIHMKQTILYRFKLCIFWVTATMFVRITGKTVTIDTDL